MDKPTRTTPRIHSIHTKFPNMLQPMELPPHIIRHSKQTRQHNHMGKRNKHDDHRTTTTRNNNARNKHELIHSTSNVRTNIRPNKHKLLHSRPTTNTKRPSKHSTTTKTKKHKTKHDIHNNTIRNRIHHRIPILPTNNNDNVPTKHNNIIPTTKNQKKTKNTPLNLTLFLHKNK